MYMVYEVSNYKKYYKLEHILIKFNPCKQVYYLDDMLHIR